MSRCCPDICGGKLTVVGVGAVIASWECVGCKQPGAEKGSCKRGTTEFGVGVKLAPGKEAV
jgi:hypothetical protein